MPNRVTDLEGFKNLQGLGESIIIITFCSLCGCRVEKFWCFKKHPLPLPSNFIPNIKFH